MHLRIKEKKVKKKIEQRIHAEEDEKEEVEKQKK